MTQAPFQIGDRVVPVWDARRGRVGIVQDLQHRRRRSGATYWNARVQWVEGPAETIGGSRTFHCATLQLEQVEA